MRERLSPVALLEAAVALALAVSLVAAARPLVRPGFPDGHDVQTHITYAYLFDAALRQGQFPVRWVQLVQDGQSQPLFNFYQPGLYYVTSLIHVVVPSLSLSLKLALLAAWWGGTLSVFLLARRWGRRAGLAAAALFAFSPYVALDLFVRAAFAEFMAMGWAAVALWLLDGYLTSGRRSYLPPLAGAGAMMIVSHLAASIAFGAVAAAMVAAVLLRLGRPGLRLAMPLVGAGALALGLSAFYWLPALGELHLVRPALLTTAYSDFRRHFVAPAQWLDFEWDYGPSVEGVDDGMSFQIGVGQWAAIVSALALLVVGAMRRDMPSQTRRLAFWLAVTAGAMVMMTEVSVVVWEHIDSLRYLQFPWRLLMVVSLSTAVLAALVVSAVRSATAQAVVVIAVLGMSLVFARTQFVPSGYTAIGRANIDAPAWRLTATASEEAFVETGFFPRAAPAQGRAPERGRWSVSNGLADVTAVEIADDRLLLEVDTFEGALLTVYSYYFPGWRAWLNGHEIAMAVSAAGYITIDVPDGRHQLEVAFADTPLRRASNLASLVSLMGVVGWWGRLTMRRRTPFVRLAPRLAPPAVRRAASCDGRDTADRSARARAGARSS